jgi:protein CpxP
MIESDTGRSRGSGAAHGRSGAQAGTQDRGRRAGWLWGSAGLAAALGLALLFSGSAGAFGRHGHRSPERGVERMLDAVEASDAQREQIRGVLGELEDLWRAQRRARRESHEAIAAALTGDEIDRAALEAIRTAQVESFQATSQQMLGALVRAAEVLTPEQRQQIAEHMREHRDHHEGHGWH